jgi:hypothetical protein
VAYSVDASGLNPNYSFAKILLASIYCRNLSYMIFSNTLENEVNKEIGL